MRTPEGGPAYSGRVGRSAAHNMYICEVSGLGVILEVCSSHHGNLASQVQLFAQVCAPLHPPASYCQNGLASPRWGRFDVEEGGAGGWGGGGGGLWIWGGEKLVHTEASHSA